MEEYSLVIDSESKLYHCMTFFCMQLTKAFVAKTSCNQLLIYVLSLLMLCVLCLHLFKYIICFVGPFPSPSPHLATPPFSSICRFCKKCKICVSFPTTLCIWVYWKLWACTTITSTSLQCSRELGTRNGC